MRFIIMLYVIFVYIITTYRQTFAFAQCSLHSSQRLSHVAVPRVMRVLPCAPHRTFRPTAAT